MALFKVTEVLNGNTIKVKGWHLGGDDSNPTFKGTRVRLHGYDIPPNDNTIAYKILTTLLENKEVELTNVSKVDKNKDSLNDDLVHCSVYLDKVDVIKYLPDVKSGVDK